MKARNKWLIFYSSVTYRNTAIGRDSSTGDYNNLSRTGENVGDILQLSAVFLPDFKDGHGDGK